MTKPLIIATVLKSGGIYDVKYVNCLANAIAKNITIPYSLICLSDVKDGFNDNVHDVKPLIHGYPKWWSKIELFKPGLFSGSKVVYLDLDTLIINNIDFIGTFNGKFCGLSDFYLMVTLGSGMMMWDGDDLHLNDIYNAFLPNFRSIINNYQYGDQQWINERTKRYLSFIQTHFPSKVVSFKKNCYEKATKSITYPIGASIVCFHGSPRIHELEQRPEISKYWNSL